MSTGGACWSELQLMPSPGRQSNASVCPRMFRRTDDKTSSSTVKSSLSTFRYSCRSTASGIHPWLIVLAAIRQLLRGGQLSSGKACHPLEVEPHPEEGESVELPHEPIGGLEDGAGDALVEGPLHRVWDELLVEAAVFQ
eukprot:CAMPEP_0195639426 /NCGR_PEP_ID=MMETSP0815-20121206/25578_1 /TAXON_ID=97485 /ORGANISM="Prymnesium parvum, Strain Texoma1" /LENGTH=138 /DNA_ID=CAMNT_0040781965 /DNA_START=411 /DNA_END=828 /DNA_ORIENTATION=-